MGFWGKLLAEMCTKKCFCYRRMSPLYLQREQTQYSFSQDGRGMTCPTQSHTLTFLPLPNQQRQIVQIVLASQRKSRLHHHGKMFFFCNFFFPFFFHRSLLCSALADGGQFCICMILMPLVRFRDNNANNI